MTDQEPPTRVTTTPWYRSPSFLIGAFMTALGLWMLTPTFPHAWRPWADSILFILGGLGFHALRAVAIDGANQAMRAALAAAPPSTERKS